MSMRSNAHASDGMASKSVFTNPRTIVLVVFGLALVVRLAYVLLRHRTGGNPIVGDSPDYIDNATRLLAGDGFQSADGTPTAYRMPGYPAFLAGVFAIFGVNPYVVGFIHAVLGAITAGIVAATGIRLAGSVAGWAAGLIVAFYPHLLLVTPWVLSETFFILVAMLALWLLVEGQARDRSWWFALAGIALAVDVLTRTMILAFVPVAAATAWWLASGKDRWVRAGFVALIPALFAALWTIRNALVLGSVTLSTQGPVALWWGNNPDLRSSHRGGHALEPPFPTPLPPHASEVEIAAAYSDALRNYIAADPLSVVRDIPVRVVNMWQPVWDGYPASTWLTIGAAYLLVVVLGVIGLLITLRSPQHQGVRYVQGYVLSLALFHAVAIGEIRLRLPIEPALAILAGIALAWLASLLQARVESAGTRRRQPGAVG